MGRVSPEMSCSKSGFSMVYTIHFKLVHLFSALKFVGKTCHGGMTCGLITDLGPWTRPTGITRAPRPRFWLLKTQLAMEKKTSIDDEKHDLAIKHEWWKSWSTYEEYKFYINDALPLKHPDVHRFSTGLITGGDPSGHQGTISLSRVGIPAQVVDQIEEEQNTQLLRGRIKGVWHAVSWHKTIV